MADSGEYTEFQGVWVAAQQATAQKAAEQAIAQQLAAMLQQMENEINYCLAHAPATLCNLLTSFLPSPDTDLLTEKRKALLCDLLRLAHENKFPDLTYVVNTQNTDLKNKEGWQLIEKQDSLDSRLLCAALYVSPLWKTLKPQLKKYHALKEMHEVSSDAKKTREQKIEKQSELYRTHRHLITQGTGIWARFCEKLEELFRNASARFLPCTRRPVACEATLSVRLFACDPMARGAAMRTRQVKDLSAALRSPILS